MFDNKERKRYKYWSFLMHVLPRIISEWMWYASRRPIQRPASVAFQKQIILRKREKMYSVTEKTIWNMKQALLKQKPQLSLTLWVIKNSFLCTRAKAETSAKHRQLLFQPPDAAAEFFPAEYEPANYFERRPHLIEQQIVPIDRWQTFQDIPLLLVYKTENYDKENKTKA